MTTLNNQVQTALNTAKYRLQNGQLHPDDDKTLKGMIDDLTSKIDDLTTERARIRNYLNELKGHYS